MDTTTAGGGGYGDIMALLSYFTQNPSALQSIVGLLQQAQATGHMTPTTSTAANALQESAGRKAITGLLNNPADIYAYDKPQYQKNGQNPLWSNPAISAMLQEQEQQYAKDLAAAKAQFITRHQSDNSTSSPYAAMPDWLRNGSTPGLTSWEQEQELKWHQEHPEYDRGGASDTAYSPRTSGGGSLGSFSNADIDKIRGLRGSDGMMNQDSGGI